MRRAGRWRAAILGSACLVTLALGGLGWRLAEQERALERERVRERLENAASLVVRESERAFEQAEGLNVAWDERGLWRTGGARLLWSPRPLVSNDAPAHWFARGEVLEFAKWQPEKAMAEYRGLLGNGDAAVRAGALMRIARCQRAMGRMAEARETYGKLAEMGATPVAQATAALVGQRELAALKPAEREKLRALLERAESPVDRATFEFFSQGLAIDPALLAWAEGVEELRRRSADTATGPALFTARGVRLAAQWTREGPRGTGRVVEFADVERRVGRVMQGSAVRWKLTERGSAAGTLVLVKTLRDTGLPWGVAVSLDPTMELRTPLLLGGLALLGLAILGALYLAYRAVRRELQVAEMQTEFVAAVSHEFRTPITALTHLTELLETGETAEERRPLYYQALARETRRLKEMVENLLDFGRMEAGRYRYKPEEVDTAELVRALVEEFKMEPAAAGREVALEAGDAKVTVDRGAMRRAVWNLLDNAAKYSPAGAPIMVRTAAADGWAELSVKDEGPGIARDEQQRIFQKFVRGRTAGSQDVKGTGIGLAMVQAIARAHGGKVDLKSEPGQGSRFTIRLPMKEK